MNIGPLIDRMIAAGVPPGEAGSIAAEIYAAGAGSVSHRSSNAERQQRFRDRNRNENVTKRNETVTNSNAETVTESVTNRNEALRSNVSTVLYRDTNIKNSKRQNSERASRGSRIDPTWAPSDADRLLARQEGFSDAETNREALRFRDYWTSRAGSGGVKLDWAATWRNWVRTSGEKLGKTPSPGGAKVQSDEVDWDAVLKTYKTIGHWSKWVGPDPSSPACRAPSEMLEKYGLISIVEPVTAPRMRAML